MHRIIIMMRMLPCLGNNGPDQLGVWGGGEGEGGGGLGWVDVDSSRLFMFTNKRIAHY